MSKCMVILALLVVSLLLVACAPKVAEPVMQPPTLTVEAGPEPVELLMWSECCSQIEPEDCVGWNDTYCDGTIKEPGDLGERMVIEWHKLHPEYTHINIKCIMATWGGGRIGQELTAMVRAGEGPNIYTLYGGRSWLAYEIGIDLDKYLPQEAKDEYLDYDHWVAEDGTVRVLPGWGIMEYPVANKQLIERACAQEGFDCKSPEPWSILPYDEYLEIADAIKALDDGSYIGILWGSLPSSQQLNWTYFAQAGMPAFKDGKFTGFAGGEDVLVELVRLYDEGYLYPDVAGITDDDAFPIWGRGKIGIMMARMGHTGVINTAVAAGECESWDPVPFLGIQFREGVVPLVTGGYFSQAGFVADNTPEEYRTAATSYMAYVLSGPSIGAGGWLDQIPLQRSQVERGTVAAGTRDEILAHINKYGLADDGIQAEAYNQVREAFGQMLTSVFLHQLTPQEGLAQFQATVSGLQGE